MDNDVLGSLQAQFNHERLNAQKYFYIADAFENMAYDGLAKFFREQAQGELVHAGKIKEYLVSKRIMPDYQMLPAVSYPVAGVRELAKVALQTEIGTTALLNLGYSVAEEAGDGQACRVFSDLLLEQIEEETWASDLVDLVNRTDENGWLILDQSYK
jgi:ferritin